MPRDERGLRDQMKRARKRIFTLGLTSCLLCLLVVAFFILKFVLIKAHDVSSTSALMEALEINFYVAILAFGASLTLLILLLRSERTRKSSKVQILNKS